MFAKNEQLKIGYAGVSKVVSPYNVAPAYGSYGAYGGYGVSKVVSPVSSVVSHGYGSPLVGGYAPAVGMISFVKRFHCFDFFLCS